MNRPLVVIGRCCMSNSVRGRFDTNTRPVLGPCERCGRIDGSSHFHSCLDCDRHDIGRVLQDIFEVQIHQLAFDRMMGNWYRGTV